LFLTSISTTSPSTALFRTERQEEFLREVEQNHGWQITPGRHAGEWDRSFDGRISLSQGEYHFYRKAQKVAEILGAQDVDVRPIRSEEQTSELQSRFHVVCR